jgi:hypothetical protein
VRAIGKQSVSSSLKIAVGKAMKLTAHVIAATAWQEVFGERPVVWPATSKAANSARKRHAAPETRFCAGAAQRPLAG